MIGPLKNSPPLIEPRSLGFDVESQREFFLLSIKTIETEFTAAGIAGRPFACLCLMDAIGIPVFELDRFCQLLLDLGCVYFCAWVADCKRVHDLMDEIIVGEDPPMTYRGRIMTTWHSESLDDALFYLMDCTFPDEEAAPNGWDAALIISIGSIEWSATTARYVGARCVRPPVG